MSQEFTSTISQSSKTLGSQAYPGILGGVEDYIDYIISRKPVVAKDYFELVKERHDDARIRINTAFTESRQELCLCNQPQKR